MDNPFEHITAYLARIEQQNQRIESLLKESQKPVKQPEKKNDLLTLEEAASFLKITKGSIYQMVHKRSIPFCKASKRLYFKESELINWVSSGRYQTVEEVEADARRR